MKNSNRKRIDLEKITKSFISSLNLIIRADNFLSDQCTNEINFNINSILNIVMNSFNKKKNHISKYNVLA